MRPLLAGLVMASVAAALALSAAPAGAATATLGIDYDLDGSPSPVPPRLNQLDLYRPSGAAAGDDRPVVVFVHGGGWRRGDKGNAIANKMNLFTGAGYVFASVDYRLSPDPIDPAYPPDRIRFPDQPDDVGEAIGWIDRNVSAYGGDPSRIILIGHSAGAQLVALVSTDPEYVTRWGVDPDHLIGTIPLDGAYDIAKQVATGTPNRRAMFFNGFATPAENAVDDAWTQGSAVHFGDPGDPRMLLVTQSDQPLRISGNEDFAATLGSGRASVLTVPYSHGEINKTVGSPADDPANETVTIMSFIDEVLSAAKPPQVKITAHPKKKVKLHRHERRAHVHFRFKAKQGKAKGFECRLDGAKFRRCSSPQSYRVAHGHHRFRVRAIGSNGDRGPAKKFAFRVVHRPR